MCVNDTSGAGAAGTHTGRMEGGNWENYRAYMHRQLGELATEFGDILAIWLDGWWGASLFPRTPT